MDRKMRHIKKITIIFLLTFALMFLSCLNLYSEKSDLLTVSDRKFILTFDFALLNCPLCIQSFTEFVDLIESFGYGDSVIGVFLVQ